MRRLFFVVGLVWLLSLPALGATPVHKIGPDLYAYISDDDSSANSTFLVGPTGVLVVDTGIDSAHAEKLLASIRSITPLPIQYVVNTHYHPDHQGGNNIIGRGATILSTAWTWQRTKQILAGRASDQPPPFRLADITFEKSASIYLGDYRVDVYHPGPAHTRGDAVVYFPQQRAVATGDLFLTDSCPAMDDGSVKNWMAALREILDLPVDTIVPGHFELASRKELARFTHYLSDLYEQVKTLRDRGVTVSAVREKIDLKDYSDFRQYPKYHATFADNAETVYHQLEQQ